MEKANILVTSGALIDQIVNVRINRPNISFSNFRMKILFVIGWFFIYIGNIC